MKNLENLFSHSLLIHGIEIKFKQTIWSQLGIPKIFKTEKAIILSKNNDGSGMLYYIFAKSITISVPMKFS